MVFDCFDPILTGLVVFAIMDSSTPNFLPSSMDLAEAILEVVPEAILVLEPEKGELMPEQGELTPESGKPKPAGEAQLEADGLMLKWKALKLFYAALALMVTLLVVCAPFHRIWPLALFWLVILVIMAIAMVRRRWPKMGRSSAMLNDEALTEVVIEP